MLTTAWLSISTIPVITYAAVRSWDVYTPGVRAAKMTSVATLINILTHITIARKPRKAHTFMRANSVIAWCMNTTIVSISFAFINVVTRPSVARKSVETTAFIGTYSVVTHCMVATAVHFALTLIDILAGVTVALESCQTAAIVRADRIYTKRMLTACGRISFTFINVLTRESISLEATSTNTIEMSLIFWICFACSVSITKWLLAAVKTCR